jgi:hypothetical protein
VVGDTIEGPDSFGRTTRLTLTAIGASMVLAVEREGLRGEREDGWSISLEPWRRVEQAKGDVSRCPGCLAAVRRETARTA